MRIGPVLRRPDVLRNVQGRTTSQAAHDYMNKQPWVIQRLLARELGMREYNGQLAGVVRATQGKQDSVEYTILSAGW